MSEKYLITGSSGFVSRHFVEFLDRNNIRATVLGLDKNELPFKFKNLKNVECSFKKVDLLNKKEIGKVLSGFKPQYVLHLASCSSVAYSWEEPVESFVNNTNIFLNLIEEIRQQKLPCRILSVGSSEEYGNVAEGAMPLSENNPLNPVSPYAVARVTQEMLSKVYEKGYDTDIIMTRSFNHIGIYQKDIFVVSSFIRQLIEIKLGKREAKMKVGDLSIIRDFVNVRDVVRAYYMLFKKGKKGELYNICSGQGYSLKTVLNLIQKILQVSAEIEVDTRRIRPDDNKIIIGSNEKIKNEIGWDNLIPFEKSIDEIINFHIENTRHIQPAVL